MNLAHIQEWVGRDLGVSEWRTVDQQRIDQFAACTGDHQWIHVDAARAHLESPFGGTIAHGFLTLSLIGRDIHDLLVRPLGVAQALNYGLERARFIAPVKSGARVRTRIRLASAEDKGNGRTLLRTESTVEIEGENKPALIADALVLAVAG